MGKVQKPKKFQITFYDYSWCEQYISQEYGFSKHAMKSFWNFVREREFGITNDSYFIMQKCWEKEILQKCIKDMAKYENILSPTTEQISLWLKEFHVEYDVFQAFFEQFSEGEDEIPFHISW